MFFMLPDEKYGYLEFSSPLTEDMLKSLTADQQAEYHRQYRMQKPSFNSEASRDFANQIAHGEVW
jgi:hypothetical protein